MGDDNDSGEDANSEELSDWGLDPEPRPMETDLSDDSMGWSDNEAELLASPPDASADEQEGADKGVAAALATSGPRDDIGHGSGTSVEERLLRLLHNIPQRALPAWQALQGIMLFYVVTEAVLALSRGAKSMTHQVLEVWEH